MCNISNNNNDYSYFIEIVKLSRTTSADVIQHMKSLFARYGIPKKLSLIMGPSMGLNCLLSSQRYMDSTTPRVAPGIPNATGRWSVQLLIKQLWHC